MKKHILFFFMFGVIAFGGISVSAQCDPASASPIKCSYYNEGYQDGISDAQANRLSDYRRYRNKFEREYEDFYRDGYNAGFNSGGRRPTTNRWANTPKSANDSG